MNTSKNKLILVLIMFFTVNRLFAADVPISQLGKQSAQRSKKTLSSNAVNMQNIITGTVVDKDGKPVIGANVKEKENPSNNAITGSDGSFRLDVSDKSTLIVSYTGFVQQEIKIGSKKTFRITLSEDSQTLQETVIVGYGTQKKVNLTGAVGIITAKQLENRPITSGVALLQGLAPGMSFVQSSGGNTPGSRPTVEIRGRAALGSVTEPLVVIDNIPSNMNDFNQLNPNDIESISLLKDAAAAAIYGARAPYGVLLVNTKIGKANEKPVLTYSDNFSLVTTVRTPHTVDSYTSAILRNQGTTDARVGNYFTEAALDIIKDNIENPGKYTLEQLNPKAGANQWGNPPLMYNNTDPMDIWLRPTSLRQQHNLSLKGGSDKTSYFVSAAYVYQPGVLNFVEKIDNYKQANLNAAVVTQVNDWLKLTYRARFSNDIATQPSFGRNNIFLFGYGAWPTSPLKLPNGEYNDGLRIRQSMLGGAATNTVNRFDNILGLDLNILKGWTAHADGTWRMAFTDNQTLNIPVPGNTNPLGDIPAVGPGSLAKATALDAYWTIQGYTAYEHSIKKHTFRVQLGASVEESNSRQLSGTAADLFIPTLPSVQIANGIRTLNDAVSTWATAGFFGRFNYDYDNKYLLEINGRYDGSGRYASDQRWGFFPSASAGWNIDRENFWKGISKVVSRAKIRGSYGTLGNQGSVAGYLYVPTMTVGSQTPWIFNGARIPYVNTPGILNPDLTWEKLTTANIGFELGFFKNRLSTEFDYFKRKTRDLIGPATPVPSVLGVSAPSANNAELATNGFELQVKWNDNIGTRWNYSVGVNLSDAISHVTKYNTTINAINGYYPGKDINEIWGYTANRLLNKADFDAASKLLISQSGISTFWYPGDVRYEDLDGNSVINAGASTVENHGDLKKIGNSTPRYQFGINLAAGYSFLKAGRLDFSMFLEGVGKQDIFMNSSYFYWGGPFDSNGSVTGTNIYPGEHLDFYRDENSLPRVLQALGQNVNAYFPRPYFNGNEGAKNFQTSSRYLLSGAYMRLRNVQLSYTLPITWLEHVKIKKCQIYFAGENLFVLSSLPYYIDPETANFGGATGRVYPQQAVYSMGLNIGF